MKKRLMEGIKVADFTWVGVGPLTTRFFGDYGAQVIHIETGRAPDVLRVTPPFKDKKPGLNRSAYFANFSCNKFGVSLNLHHPEAKEITQRLICWADIVAESYTPGTMARWGLGYEDLVKIKPDIIMFSTCQQGQTGPRATQAAYGTQLVSLAGFTELTGWPDRGPVGPYGPYTDTTAPMVGAAAVIAALLRREKTGEGIHIDLSQFEAGIQFLGPLFLEYSANNKMAQRKGNRDDSAVPHGVFPCKGEDMWCTIAIFTDQEWDIFKTVLSSKEWVKDGRFSTILGRKENEDELEGLIAEWTIVLDAFEIMHKLQGIGLEAGVVQKCEDIHKDPQIEYRKFLPELEHPEIGKHRYDGCPFIMSETPYELVSAGHCLGQHNEYVYTRVLGLTDDEFIQYLSHGVFE